MIPKATKARGGGRATKGGKSTKGGKASRRRIDANGICNSFSYGAHTGSTRGNAVRANTDTCIEADAFAQTFDRHSSERCYGATNHRRRNGGHTEIKARHPSSELVVGSAYVYWADSVEKASPQARGGYSGVGIHFALRFGFGLGVCSVLVGLSLSRRVGTGATGRSVRIVGTKPTKHARVRGVALSSAATATATTRTQKHALTSPIVVGVHTKSGVCVVKTV